MEIMRVGIPRALFFYSYLPFWETFWSELGYEVVVSPLTNKDILDQGIAQSATDLCVPVKILHGHISHLVDQEVDLLFVPRMVGVGANDTFCPKFLALPEMINCSFSKLPAMVSPRIDVHGQVALLKLCATLQRRWGSKQGLWKSFQKARLVQSNYEGQLANGLLPDQAWPTFAVPTFEKLPSPKPMTSGLKIAVLGYPYSVYDSFINNDVIKKLRRLGVDVVTNDMIPLRKSRPYQLSKELFWHYSNKVIQAGIYWLNQRISGIIHITNFACGPDAMVGKMLELACKKQGKPLLTLTLDEQTGQVGVNTRIEAFVDMLQRRVRYAYNLPLHG